MSLFPYLFEQTHSQDTISHVSLSDILFYQVTQKKAFTSCRMLLNWVPNQRNCWRQPYKICKEGKHTSFLQRIRKIYNVSIYLCVISWNSTLIGNLQLKCNKNLWYINFYCLICTFPMFCLSVSSNSNVHDSVKKGSVFQKVSSSSDGTGDLQLSSIFGSG